MNKAGMLGLVLLMLSGHAVAAASSPEADIRSLLQDQVEAWNRGDFEGFMAYYWKSPDLTFQSGARRLKGWRTLLDRYRSNYAGTKRGELAFRDLTIVVLSPQHAYALGRFVLEYPTEVQQGLFTIILKLFPQGWRIVHDHSSS